MKKQNLELKNKDAELNSNNKRRMPRMWLPKQLVCHETVVVYKSCTCLTFMPPVLALPLLD